MEKTHTFNQTVTTDQVVHVPVDEQREALRQAIFRDPAFEEWRKYLAEKRRELSQKVAANEAEARMSDYTEFIEAEYHASRPVAVKTAPVMQSQCKTCNGEGMIRETHGLIEIDEACPSCFGDGTVSGPLNLGEVINPS